MVSDNPNLTIPPPILFDHPGVGPEFKWVKIVPTTDTPKPKKFHIVMKRFGSVLGARLCKSDEWLPVEADRNIPFGEAVKNAKVWDAYIERQEKNSKKANKNSGRIA